MSEERTIYLERARSPLDTWLDEPCSDTDRVRRSQAPLLEYVIRDMHPELQTFARSAWDNLGMPSRRLLEDELHEPEGQHALAYHLMREHARLYAKSQQWMPPY